MCYSSVLLLNWSFLYLPVPDLTTDTARGLGAVRRPTCKGSVEPGEEEVTVAILAQVSRLTSLFPGRVAGRRPDCILGSGLWCGEWSCVSGDLGPHEAPPQGIRRRY